MSSESTASTPPNPLLDVLLSRYSLGVKHLGEPGPNESDLQVMAAAALRAPDHGEITPWRFALVRGAAREKLAGLFAQHAKARGKDDEGVAIERERALKAPLTVAVIARIDRGHPLASEHEQWMAVGGAVTNFLNAAHALGYAGKMLSGDKARAPHILQAFCEPGETLVGWMSIGTPLRALGTNRRKDASEVLRDWG